MKRRLSVSKHFYTTKELYDEGFSYYRITKLVEEGTLIKLNKSLYENTLYNGETDDFSIAASLVPKGVICMMSAARYYGLTNYLPDAVDVAIERSMKFPTVPSWPSINTWFFSNNRYETGIIEIRCEERAVRIYDCEKTVVDIVCFRKRIGIEETREVLTGYLRRRDRDLEKLHHYAELLGCHKILSTYLEVLL
ncbi:MAG: hypothetical protein IJM15_02510 [Erysipelotrichaceae bacterium]|nr:hypothetical protein [Erysipelotrichaceae bacterium]